MSIGASRPLAAVVLALVAGAAVPAYGDVIVGQPAFDALVAQYPGARMYEENGRVQAIYGIKMTRAADPFAAAELFLAQHGDVYGIPGLDLRLDWVAEVNHGKFTNFHYRQYIDGVPVEFGFGNVLVRSGAPEAVVYSGARLARPAPGGFADMAVTGQQALDIVQNMPAYENLGNWSEPELVAYYGEGDLAQNIDAIRAWKFTANGMGGIFGHRAYTFYVDAATGALTFARFEVYDIDVTGTVRGMATPGLRPDVATNPPTLQNIGQVRVQVQGGNTSTTLRDGSFIIPHPGATPVTVNSSLVGPWVTVVDVGGSGNLTASVGNVTPPGPANLVFNAAPTAHDTAEVNAFIHTTSTHDYIKDRAPSWTPLDISLRAEVNRSQTCNAFFTTNPLSINFYAAGGGCANTAYTTVIAHEYGHFIVNRRGLAQGAFGEGYSDTVAMLQYDTPVVGEEFQGANPVRRPGQIVQTYPCSSTAIHTCGQIVGGVWWRIRTGFGNRYGSQLGLELVQQLHVDWTLITGGGIGVNSAHPQTAIEVLTIDDDDGNLNNGTPHYNEICAAFGTHLIPCPPLSLIAFEYPNGRPDSLLPSVAQDIDVRVVALGSQPQPGSLVMRYRANGGAYQTATVVETSPNVYTATLPGFPCLDEIDYYFEAQASGGQVVRDPENAPTSAFSASVYTSRNTVFHDDFSTNLGWTFGAPDDNAPRGIWNRMMPQQTSTGGQTVQPGFTPTGTACMVTDGRAGTSVGAWDVDEGKTTIISPVLDLTGTDSVVSYYRWYTNHAGASPFNDIFVVDVSNNGGQTWTNVETIGPSGPQVMGGWYHVSHRVNDAITPTSQMRFRFVASDYDPQALVEALVDDFRVEETVCAPACYPDCDTSTGPGVLDIFDFLCFGNKFDQGDPYACDCDVSTGPGVCDIFDFLCFGNAFDQGCP